MENEMKHKITLESEILARALKDAALYVAKDDLSQAISHVLLLLNPKKKNLSVIACDGCGYYERVIEIIQEKGVKPSLPGKPMHIFISRNDLAAISKSGNIPGILSIETDDGKKVNDSYAVKFVFPDGKISNLSSPSTLEIPDYSFIRKQAEKGKKAKVSLGQMMLPVRELTRAGKVFPVKTGFTVPMYISQWKKGGLLTLLEYQSEFENVDIKVIFAISLPEAA